MNPNSSTYRLFSLLLVVLVFASASMPAGLHQHDHDAEECTMHEHHDNEQVTHEDAQEDCDEHQKDDHTSESDHADHDTDSDDHENACDLGIACACSIDEAPVKPEAIPGFASAKVILSETAQDLLQPFELFQHFREAPEPNLNSYPPPIFLLVSTFLN